MSWGRVVRARHYVARPRFADEAETALRQARAENRAALGVGLGRSYGDSNLNPDGALIDMTSLDRIISFDKTVGTLRIEAGASLSDILRLIVPHGWFLPTTPGTRYVTLGGAIANDVHGKNHHRAGSIGCSVRRIGLVRSDCGALELGPDSEPELFAATIGGLGLTGLMRWVEIQLVPIASAFIDQEIEPFDNLDGFFTIARASEDLFEHTVAWVDCTARGADLGRGVFMRGNWASEGELTPHAETRKLKVPIDGTSAAFTPAVLKFGNALYRMSQTLKPSRARTHYAAHFYPLDAIGAWNRLYGAQGFYQYQCVLPHAQAEGGLREMMDAVAKDGAGSILVVLKTFGARRSPGLLSFPTPGVTLAMDFHNAGMRTHRLFERLDQSVRAAGGRLYPAKDGRMPTTMFQEGYPEWSRFGALRDPALSSAFWRRVSQ